MLARSRVAVPLLDVQRSVESVVRALREREDELVSVMLERTATEAPEAGIQDDPDMAAAMRESCYANLRAALAELARDRSPLPSGPPAGAVEEALASAQAGVPLDALLQTYRIGHAVAWDAMLERSTRWTISTAKRARRCCSSARGTRSPTSIG